jgi:hypothetical protein
MTSYITHDLWIKNAMINFKDDDLLKLQKTFIDQLQKRLDKAMEWEDVKISLPLPIEGIDFVDCIVASPSEVFCARFTTHFDGTYMFYDYDRRGPCTKYITHWLQIKPPCELPLNSDAMIPPQYDTQKPHDNLL